MSEWLQTYNEMFGMYHAGIITTIFGAFAVTFTVLMSWPKLVKDFGPIGGFMAAALIIGTHPDIWRQLLYHRNKWISPELKCVIKYLQEE